jgi:hypothetical protein
MCVNMKVPRMGFEKKVFFVNNRGSLSLAHLDPGDVFSRFPLKAVVLQEYCTVSKHTRQDMIVMRYFHKMYKICHQTERPFCPSEYFVKRTSHRVTTGKKVVFIIL